jgi:antitoxin component of MazEF toxin-antitoxin module
MYKLFVKDGEFMNIQLKKIGNSKGIIIPAAILKMLDIKEYEELTIKVEGKEIILSKVIAFYPKSLEELFLGILTVCLLETNPISNHREIFVMKRQCLGLQEN